MFKFVGNVLDRAKRKLLYNSPPETEALYKILYDQVHDLEKSREIVPDGTRKSFAHQWQELPKGEYLLSDPWFKENVDRILCEQEILLKRDWFRGKKVLDAGCGNGRWAYGFSRLGADITCVDQAESALHATRNALSEFSNAQQFVHSELETLNTKLKVGSYDLVFSWGVLHHCNSYTRSLENVASMVREGGILYVYLYGRDSLPMKNDLDLFKKRIAYNLLSSEEKYKFLLIAAGGDESKVHNFHDIYAPLINRRFTFEEVKGQLESLGFSQVTRTINHTEIFVRATKGDADMDNYTHQAKAPPYWFEGHHI